MFESVGLVARYDKKPALKLTEELAEYLKSKGLKVSIEDTLSGKVATQEEFVPLPKMKTEQTMDGNKSHQTGWQEHQLEAPAYLLE